MNLNNRILQVDGLTKTYGKDTTKTEALRGISFDVLEGEFLGIMGASGSGKTTLLNCIATMTRPTTIGAKTYRPLPTLSWRSTADVISAICSRNLNCWTT